MRKPFVIVLAVIIVLAAGAMAYIYRDMWIKKPQQLVTIVQKETVSIYFPTGQGKLIEKKIDITSNLSDKEKGNFIIRNLKTLKSIPEELTLNDLVVDSDGILYLEFFKRYFRKKDNINDRNFENIFNCKFFSGKLQKHKQGPVPR